MSKIKKLNLSDIKKAVAENVSMSGVCRSLGLIEGSNGTRLKKVIIANDIDTSHFTGQLWSKGKTCLDDFRIGKYKEEDILSKESKVSSGCVRELLIKKNLIERKCDCGISDTWNGKPISLQLDHINGNRKDQSLENLRWICPNCHSQTSTFCSKNRRDNKKTVSDNDLIDSLKCSENIRQGLARFGLDNEGNYSRAKRLINLHGIEFSNTIIDPDIVPSKNDMLRFIDDDYNDMKKRKESSKQEKIRNCKVCNSKIHYKSKFYCSRNCMAVAQTKSNPTYEVLIEELKTVSQNKLAIQYGVSSTTIRRWSKALVTKSPTD